MKSAFIITLKIALSKTNQMLYCMWCFNQLYRLLLFSFIFSFSNAFSQSSIELENEAKYWVWRDRLISDFVVPGTCTGCGIVIKWRGAPWPLDDVAFNDYYGGFDIGDEGFEMGLYLAVLATEWYIMLNSGMTTEREKTELELFYELKAIDRLDVNAEVYWNETWNGGYGSPPTQTNGFMIRDDVFEDFLSSNPNDDEAYQRFLYLNQGNGGTTGKYIEQSILPRHQSTGECLTLSQYNDIMNIYPEWNRSGFSGGSAGYRDNPPFTGPKEYSQDNYIGLMMGLCTVIRLLPPNVEVANPDNCSEIMNIKEHAIEILSRILEYMSASKIHFLPGSLPPEALLYNPNIATPCPDQVATDCWLLTNPVTKMCVKGVRWKEYFDDFDNLACRSYCNYGGAEASSFSCNFNKIYSKYCNGSLFFCSPCDILFINDNSTMKVILATLSSYRNELTNDRILEEIQTWTDDTKKWDLMYLDILSCILWKTTDGFPQPTPAMPVNYYETCLSLIRCGTDWDINDDYTFKRSNLLPQMLLHNLVKIQKGNPQYYMPDYNSTKSIEQDYPFLSNVQEYGGSDGFWHKEYTIRGSNTYIAPDGFGTTLFKYNSNPTVWANGQMESTSIINSYYFFNDYTSHYFTGYVNFISGKKIVLKPGFKVNPAAYFNAKIDESLYCGIREGTMDYLMPCSYNLKSGFGTFLSKEDTNSTSDVEFFLMPNPCSNYFKIVPLNSKKSNCCISATIISITGVTLDFVMSENNIINYNTSELPQGIYIIKTCINSNCEYYKLVKE